MSEDDRETLKKIARKRYSVCVFPSYLGTPWTTDSWIVAKLWGWWRSFTEFPCELRIIDHETGEHYVS